MLGQPGPHLVRGGGRPRPGSIEVHIERTPSAVASTDHGPASAERVELRRHVGVGGRPLRRDAPAQVQGDRRYTWAEMDRRADGIAADAPGRRRRSSGQGGAVPLQRPRVPRVDVRPLQGRARPGQHQLPLHRRRAGVPVDQRRRRRGDLPRLVRRPGRTGAPPGAGGSRPGCTWPTRAARPARLGHRRTRRRRVSASTRTWRPVGTQRRRPVHPLHRRHDRDAEGRDVAPGRRRRQPRRRRPAVRCPRSRRPPPWPSAWSRPGPVNLPGRAAHARHRRVQRHVEPDARRLGRHARPARSFDVVELLDTCQREQVKSISIVGDAFAKPDAPSARRRARPVGHLEPCG